MEEALQHQTTTQCSGLPPTGPGNHRPNGTKANHALTFKIDHFDGADHDYQWFTTFLYKLAKGVRKRRFAESTSWLRQSLLACKILTIFTLFND